MSDEKRVVEFPKSWNRKLDRIKKKTPFRFDPVPSNLTEYWIAHLDLPELRCMLYICRRTWGFRKEWDAISMKQFCSGVKNRDGKQVDSGVGFGETYVRAALKRLERDGLIEVNRRNTRAHLFRVTVRLPLTLSEPQAQVCPSH